MPSPPGMLHKGITSGWSSDFDTWAAGALARGDVEELAAWRDRAPGMHHAHPTPDHSTPPFITLGAGGEPERPVRTVIDGYVPDFAKRSFQTV
ncbi:hypothetical protein ACH41H_47930 [Streptomyces sp. NPDC020800]|uniref:hypothetical protein n=1 Tax=Streptomyces sp. NPDC020800 TaxID=3365092 RepID=UPI0037B235F5